MTDVEIQKEEAGQAQKAPAQENETKSVIDTARELKEQIAKENDRREELLKREEALEARRMLGGRADAGQTQQLSEEDKKKQGAKEFWAGSGIDKSIEKYG